MMHIPVWVIQELKKQNHHQKAMRSNIVFPIVVKPRGWIPFDFIGCITCKMESSVVLTKNFVLLVFGKDWWIAVLPNLKPTDYTHDRTRKMMFIKYPRSSDLKPQSGQGGDDRCAHKSGIIYIIYIYILWNYASSKGYMTYDLRRPVTSKLAVLFCVVHLFVTSSWANCLNLTLHSFGLCHRKLESPNP